MADLFDDITALKQSGVLSEIIEECKQPLQYDWRKSKCGECGYYCGQRCRKHGCKVKYQTDLKITGYDPACPDYVPREAE